MSAYSVVEKRGGKTRQGKGFSKSELREVGLNFQTALRLRIPVDERRKTKHEENVKTLKQRLKKRG